MSDQETVTTPPATSAVEKPQNEIIPAFIKAQSEIDGIAKDKKSQGGKFSFDFTNIDHILNSIRPILATNGLAVSFNLITSPNEVTIRLTLFHKSGQSMVWDGFAMPMNSKNPQDIGSVVTYGKRYQLAAALGIALEEDMDDDAVRATKAGKPTPAKQGSQAVADQLETTQSETSATLGEQVSTEIRKELDELGVTPDSLREAMIKKAKLPAAIVNGPPADWPRDWGGRVRKYLDSVKAANARAAKQAAEAEQQEEGEA